MGNVPSEGCSGERRGLEKVGAVVVCLTETAVAIKVVSRLVTGRLSSRQRYLGVFGRNGFPATSWCRSHDHLSQGRPHHDAASQTNQHWASSIRYGRPVSRSPIRTAMSDCLCRVCLGIEWLLRIVKIGLTSLVPL